MIKLLLILALSVNVMFAVTIHTGKESYAKGESIVVEVADLPKASKCTAQKRSECSWVGLFYAFDESAPEHLVKYQYAGTSTSETFTFSGLNYAGEYEARVFYKDTYNEEGFYNFKVTDVQHPTVQVQTVKNTYEVNEAISVSFSNLPGNSNDWVGLFYAFDGSEQVHLLQKIETQGQTSGTVTFVGLDEAHDFEVRAFANGTFTEEDYYPFTVVEAVKPVTPCNILQNSSFENNTNGWSVYGDNALVSGGYDGNKALKIKNGGLDQMSQKIIGAVDTYQFNGYYKTVGNTDGIWLGMGFYDNDKNFLFERSYFLKNVDTYTQFILNATATEDTKYIETWIWTSSEQNSGSAVFDSLKLSTSSCYNYALPSSLPPAGLKANQVPQFVVLGFDDNTKSEGIYWAMSLFENKYNKDGSAATTSFYVNTVGLREQGDDDPHALLTAMQGIIPAGHEIGSHTDNHHDMLDGESEDAFFSRIKKLSRAEWQERIDSATADLMHLVGIAKSDIKGFRAPYLLFNQHSMDIINEENFLYDCSIEDGYAPEFDGTNFRWPYQLNEGSPGHNESWYGNQENVDYVDIKTVEGLWELPSYPVMIPKDSECAAYNIPVGFWDRLKERLPYIDDYRMTGLDYNIWTLGGATKAEMLGLLKYNLDLRLSGNRAPFMFGTHSQYYTEEWADENAPNANVTQMRAALKEFVEYALSKDVVRIKTGKDIIEWCKNPQEL